MATIVALRQPIADHLIASQLRKLGLTPAEFEITRFDSEAFELTGLRIGDRPDLEASRIEVRYSAGELLSGRLDALRIEGVRIRGSISDEGVSLGALDPFFVESAGEDGETAEATGPAAIPFARIELDDARMNLDTDVGPLEATLSAKLSETGEGEIEARVDLSVTHPTARLTVGLAAAGSLDSIVGDVELQASAVGRWGATTTDGASVTTKTGFTIEDGEISIQPEGCVALHIESLAVDSTLALMKPLDLCLRSSGEAAIQIFRDGVIQTQLELTAGPIDAEFPSAEGAGFRISGELPTFRVETRWLAEGLEVSVETEAGHLEFPGLAIDARGIALEARLPARSAIPSGRLRIQEIFDRQSPARLSPVSADGRFGPDGSGIDFEIELASSNRELVLTASGRHDLDRGNGQVEVRLEPVVFAPGSVQPTDLFPILSDAMTEVSGSVWANGAGEWTSDDTHSRLEIFVSDFNATSELASIERLNGALAFRDRGASQEQLISMGRINFGIELTDGLIDYQIDSEGVIEIESASWKFAGGELRTAGRIDLWSPKQEISLQVKGVDLAELIALVDMKGLTGSGKLDGKLPLFRSGEDIEIRNAVLHSRDGGVIRYLPESGVTSLGASNQQFFQTLTILENLHYDELEFKINGIASGAVLIEVHIAGKNPDYMDGQAVNFNLSLDEQQLPGLLQASRVTYQVPGAIQRKMDASK